MPHSESFSDRAAVPATTLLVYQLHYAGIAREVELRYIDYLVKAAERGSFSKAATVVGVAQVGLARQTSSLMRDAV